MFKIALISLAVGLVAAANAVVFTAVSVGTFTLGGGGYTTSETVVFQITPSPVTSMFFDATYVGAGAEGTITYSGSGGTITLDFVAPGPFEFGDGGLTSSLDGTWTYSSGTGDYAGYASGAGVFAAAYNAVGTYASTTLTGSLEPVPEPATLAAFGLGLAAFGRRLRRR